MLQEVWSTDKAGKEADIGGWVFACVSDDQIGENEFLIDSGAAASVCKESLAGSLGSYPSGRGMQLRSATGQ